MRVCALLVLFTLAPISGYAQTSAPFRVVFDSYMTPAAGAEDLLAAQHISASAEDRWLPLKIGAERSRSTLALGLMYRGGKFLALDIPQDHFLMVVAHEVFGHGARFRELGEGSLRYGFDAPIPYGSGDAVTKFNGRFPISPLANLNVTAAGIEGQHALADAILDRAVARGRLHYREAWLYFESRLTAISYTLSASPTSAQGHDIADYLDEFHIACVAPCSPLTRNYVQRRSLLGLADPLVYYSVYGFAVSYIGNGSTTGPMPLIPLGRGMRVLPSLGYALAPYGGEYTVRAAFQSEHRAQQGGMRLANIAVRIGNTGGSSTWGVDGRALDVARLRGLRIGIAANVWRQPHLLADQTSDALHVGGGIVGTTIVPFPRALRSQWSEGIYVSAGYKSQGFVPGEQLAGGAVVRAGITMR